MNDDDPLQETAYTYIAKYAVTDQHELLQLVRAVARALIGPVLPHVSIRLVPGYVHCRVLLLAQTVCRYRPTRAAEAINNKGARGGGVLCCSP